MAPLEPVPLDHSHLASRLQRCFQQRDVYPVNFLVVGLRAESDVIISLFSRGICAVLSLDYEVCADFNRGRIAVMLATVEHDAAQRFSHDLRTWLLDEAPKEAFEVLSNVTTTFIPGGCGYAYAEELLEYLMGAA